MVLQKDNPPERIVRSARDLFFELGVARVTTDMLAKEAAVSKTTLYKYFPSMADVLRAVTDAEADSFASANPRTVETLDELRDALTDYGASLMTFLNKPEILQFSHLMHEEARAHPDIASVFYKAAYGRTLRIIAALIAQGIEKRFLMVSLTAEELAEQLVGMWEGIPFVRAQMGITKRPFPKPRQWSEKCVNTLIDANI